MLRAGRVPHPLSAAADKGWGTRRELLLCSYICGVTMFEHGEENRK